MSAGFTSRGANGVNRPKEEPFALCEVEGCPFEEEAFARKKHPIFVNIGSELEDKTDEPYEDEVSRQSAFNQTQHIAAS